MSPAKKKEKEKSRARKDRKRVVFFSLLYIRRSRIITPAVCPMYKSSDTKEERERGGFEVSGCCCCCCCCWFVWCCVELNGFYVLILYNTASLRQKESTRLHGWATQRNYTKLCVCSIIIYLCVCVSILHGPGFVDSIYLKNIKGNSHVGVCAA